MFKFLSPKRDATESSKETAGSTEIHISINTNEDNHVRQLDLGNGTSITLNININGTGKNKRAFKEAIDLLSKTYREQNCQRLDITKENYDKLCLEHKGIYVAHVAATYGMISPHFLIAYPNLGTLCLEDGVSVAHIAIPKMTRVEINGLYDNPQCRNKFFSLSTATGWTVAHELANRRNLPINFNLWDLADEDGWTVAHEAAEKKSTVPHTVDVLSLADEDGWTVAHEAAEKKSTVPHTVDVLSLADEDGWSVAHELASCGNLDLAKLVNNAVTHDILTITDSDSWSVAHEYVEQGKSLYTDIDPAIYDLTDDFGITVWEIAMQHGVLPIALEVKYRFGLED